MRSIINKMCRCCDVVHVNDTDALGLRWQVIRPMFSNPPRHGAAIVVTVLQDPELYSLWRVRAWV